MEYISTPLARVIWFCHTRDINPKGISLYPAIGSLLKEHYAFRKMPQEIDMAKSMTFEDGAFLTDRGDLIIVNLNLSGDWIYADTYTSTNDAESFLNDLFGRLSKEYGLADHATINKRIGYVSQLYFTTKASLEFLNPKLKAITKYLSTNAIEGEKYPYEVTKLTVAPDPANKIIPGPFTFERQDNTSFSENRYFSHAPLPTDKHIELVEEVEKILSK